MDGQNEMPEAGWLDGWPEGERQLFWQVELLARDIGRLSDPSFTLNESSSPLEGANWHLSFTVRDKVPLSPSELQTLARRHLAWATHIDVRIEPSPFDEPYLFVDLYVSPLPPLSHAT